MFRSKAKRIAALESRIEADEKLIDVLYKRLARRLDNLEEQKWKQNYRR